MKLWDVQTEREIMTLDVQHEYFNYICAFSSDGHTMAILLNPKIVELPETKAGRIIKTLSMNTGVVCRLAFSPDGLILAIGSKNNLQCWLLTSKVMSKLQSERLKHYENSKHQIEESIQHGKKMQQEQWRSEGRCEVCGERLGFSLTRKTRCKKHL